jgi:hypothetical protein
MRAAVGGQVDAGVMHRAVAARSGLSAAVLFAKKNADEAGLTGE